MLIRTIDHRSSFPSPLSLPQRVDLQLRIRITR